MYEVNRIDNQTLYIVSVYQHPGLQLPVFITQIEHVRIILSISATYWCRGNKIMNNYSNTL